MQNKLFINASMQDSTLYSLTEDKIDASFVLQ